MTVSSSTDSKDWKKRIQEINDKARKAGQLATNLLEIGVAQVIFHQKSPQNPKSQKLKPPRSSRLKHPLDIWSVVVLHSLVWTTKMINTI